ncbi:MAG: MBL fold metallo-hydrolase [Anaerolineae bacterium]
MIVKRLVVGMLMTNCYLIGCEETKEGAIIDPGDDKGGEAILEEVRASSLKVCYILNTHEHFDHTWANEAVMKATGAPLAAHPAAVPMIKRDGGADFFGLRASSPEPEILLEEGDFIALGRVKLKVLHTPGHSPGSISFYAEEEGILFDGDVLFNMGIGRADLPGGDLYTLMESIRTKVLTLPDETIIYPGHGPKTTVGREKRNNPFL